MTKKKEYAILKGRGYSCENVWMVFYTYYPKWPQYSADVQDNTNDQVFLVGSEYWKTNDAINDMGGIGLELQDGIM